MHKEASTCSYLNDNGKSFVPFIGVYSTKEHPFALVFELMEHLNLSVYLRNNREVGRVDLVWFRRRIHLFQRTHGLDASYWK